MAGCRCDPGTQYDSVDKGDAAEFNPSQGMSAKHDTASYIVAGDCGSFEPPKLDQLGEQTRLGRDRDIQPLSTLRLAEPEKVECVHGKAAGELRPDDAPDV